MAARFTKAGPVPAEVTGFFAGKADTPAFSWEDVWREEHAYRFTVAKAVELDVLQAFRQTIAEGIAKGQSFESWKAELQPRLAALGWWGKRRVADPKGERRPRTVDFSQPYRLERIYFANLRAARAAGQWRRAQRTKDALPYFVYVESVSKEKRDEHRRFVGFVARVDHPFWRTHFPPNGWNCKCAVRQISEEEAAALGATPEEELTFFMNEKREWRNSRTGELVQVPLGLDPSWDAIRGSTRRRPSSTRSVCGLRPRPKRSLGGPSGRSGQAATQGRLPDIARPCRSRRGSPSPFKGG